MIANITGSFTLRSYSWVLILLFLNALTPSAFAATDNSEQKQKVGGESSSSVQVNRSSSSVISTTKTKKAPVVVKRKKNIQVDERPIWKLFHEGKFKQARELYQKEQAKQPDWKGSKDLMTALQGMPTTEVDERPIWELIHKGERKQAMASIQQARKEHPDWKPPKALISAVKGHSKLGSRLATKVDERPIWELIHKGKRKQAITSIQQARKEHPDWKPSKALISAVKSHLNIDSWLKKNRASKNWSVIVKNYKKNSDQFNCRHAYRRMSVAEAYLALQQESDALKLYSYTLRHCKDKDRIEALEHASGHLAIGSMGYLLEQLDKKPLASNYRSRRNAVALRYWMNLDKTGNHPEALSHIDKMLPEIEKLKRHDLHEAIAWMNLRHHRVEDALKHFHISRSLKDTDAALKGQLIALYESGKAEKMKKLMNQETSRLKKMNALQDLYPLLAAACGKIEDEACQMEMYGKIEEFRPLSFDEEEAKTWILYNSEKFTQAADSFERLYRIKQTEGVAKGLFVSLMRLGQTNRATRLGDEYGGPFQKILSSGDAERFYMRKLFHAAQAYDESFDDSLKYLDKEYVRLSFMQRRRSGNQLLPAFDQFVQRKMVLEGGVYKDKKHLFNIIYEPTSIDVGVPVIQLGDNFGSNPIVPTPTKYPIETRHTGYEWSLGYRYEDWRSWYAEFGQGFSYGRMRPMFKGKLGVNEQYLSGFTQAELYRQPVRSSFLSYAGMIDPFTNKSWGRVSKTGIKINGYTLTGIPDIGLTYLLLAERMKGVSVKKNKHIQVNAFIPYHFQWFDDTEWSVGPMYQWERYNNDQGHYMVGHGGYFSPQDHHYFGINARFISREAATYNYEFRGFIGQETYANKATPLLPLSPDGRMFRNQRLRAKMYQVQGKVVRDLPWNLQIGGSCAWSNGLMKNGNAGGVGPVPADNYQELLISVFLTWQPEDRDVTLSSDQPIHNIDTLY